MNLEVPQKRFAPGTCSVCSLGCALGWEAACSSCQNKVRSGEGPGDLALRLALGEFRDLLAQEKRAEGKVRTDRVRAFLRRTAEKLAEFRELAYTIILLAEALMGAPCEACGNPTLHVDHDADKYECHNPACSEAAP